MSSATPGAPQTPRPARVCRPVQHVVTYIPSQSRPSRVRPGCSPICALSRPLGVPWVALRGFKARIISVKCSGLTGARRVRCPWCPQVLLRRVRRGKSRRDCARLRAEEPENVSPLPFLFPLVPTLSPKGAGTAFRPFISSPHNVPPRGSATAARTGGRCPGKRPRRRSTTARCRRGHPRSRRRRQVTTLLRTVLSEVQASTREVGCGEALVRGDNVPGMSRRRIESTHVKPP